ncbi:glycoside hydrolase family 75 protein [Vibrio aerogenes]|uniref:glycoside hydrolase family 75 protein n=1 Tax=Vibrio aerogenes TaxID=92172 RepID=UPI0021C32087|nr:glycoside hydrolase family 75 protein [Vibrio aerogenes]
MLRKMGLVCLLLSGSSIACDGQKWITYKDTLLIKGLNENFYVYQTSYKAIDADGAPNSYHPDDIGLDYLENAGYPDKGWKNVLVVDPEQPEKPFVQKSGKYKGYFLSKTSLQNKNKSVTDPDRYVNSVEIPYIVFPKSFYDLKGTGYKGDLGYAYNLKTKKSSAFVFADIGPRQSPLGEMSIALAERLGGVNVNPRNGSGTPSGDILYIVFPSSSKDHRWPMTNTKLETTVKSMMQKNNIQLDSFQSCF